MKTCTVLLLGAVVWGTSGAWGQSPAPPPCQGSDTVDTANKAMAGPARAFAGGVRAAVAADNRQALARMISYPLRVYFGPKRKIVIRSKTDFLAHYAVVVTPKVKAALAQPDMERCLFYNYNGFMIGDGEIWFDGRSADGMKIVSMNP